jgi:hypothetical protein
VVFIRAAMDEKAVSRLVKVLVCSAHGRRAPRSSPSISEHDSTSPPYRGDTIPQCKINWTTKQGKINWTTPAAESAYTEMQQVRSLNEFRRKYPMVDCLLAMCDGFFIAWDDDKYSLISRCTAAMLMTNDVRTAFVKAGEVGQGSNDIYLDVATLLAQKFVRMKNYIYEPAITCQAQAVSLCDAICPDIVEKLEAAKAGPDISTAATSICKIVFNWRDHARKNYSTEKMDWKHEWDIPQTMKGVWELVKNRITRGEVSERRLWWLSTPTDSALTEEAKDHGTFGALMQVVLTVAVKNVSDPARFVKEILSEDAPTPIDELGEKTFNAAFEDDKDDDKDDHKDGDRDMIINAVLSYVKLKLDSCRFQGVGKFVVTEKITAGVSDDFKKTVTTLGEWNNGPSVGDDAILKMSVRNLMMTGILVNGVTLTMNGASKLLMQHSAMQVAHTRIDRYLQWGSVARSAALGVDFAGVVLADQVCIWLGIPHFERAAEATGLVIDEAGQGALRELAEEGVSNLFDTVRHVTTTTMNHIEESFERWRSRSPWGMFRTRRRDAEQTDTTFRASNGVVDQQLPVPQLLTMREMLPFSFIPSGLLFTRLPFADKASVLEDAHAARGPPAPPDHPPSPFPRSPFPRLKAEEEEEEADWDGTGPDDPRSFLQRWQAYIVANVAGSVVGDDQVITNLNQMPHAGTPLKTLDVALVANAVNNTTSILLDLHVCTQLTVKITEECGRLVAENQALNDQMITTLSDENKTDRLYSEKLAEAAACASEVHILEDRLANLRDQLVEAGAAARAAATSSEEWHNAFVQAKNRTDEEHEKCVILVAEAAQKLVEAETKVRKTEDTSRTAQNDVSLKLEQTDAKIATCLANITELQNSTRALEERAKLTIMLSNGYFAIEFMVFLLGVLCHRVMCQRNDDKPVKDQTDTDPTPAAPAATTPAARVAINMAFVLYRHVSTEPGQGAITLKTTIQELRIASGTQRKKILELKNLSASQRQQSQIHQVRIDKLVIENTRAGSTLSTVEAKVERLDTALKDVKQECQTALGMTAEDFARALEGFSVEENLKKIQQWQVHAERYIQSTSALKAENEQLVSDVASLKAKTSADEAKIQTLEFDIGQEGAWDLAMSQDVESGEVKRKR